MQPSRPTPSSWVWKTDHKLRRAVFEEEGQSREVTAVAVVAAAAAAALALLDASRCRSSAKVKQTAAPAQSMRGRARHCLLCSITRERGG